MAKEFGGGGGEHYNYTTDNSDSAYSPTTSSSVRLLTYEESALAVIIYTLISLVATVGNLSVIFIILHFQRMRTPTNYLILNLCVADFLMAALCIPFSYWPVLILQHWPFGWFLCKAISFSQAAVVMSSAYTLVAISLDRFLAILCPMNPSFKLTRARSIALIGSVWLISIVIASPLLVVMDLMPDPDYPRDRVHCVEDWTIMHHSGSGSGAEAESADEDISAALQAAYHYSVAAMVLQYFLPLVVLIVTYGGIGLRLWYSKVPGEGGKDVMKGRKDSVKKMMPTMFIVTAIYAICWCPLNVLNILTGVYSSMTEYRYILYVWGLCHFLAMFNSMANPLIYFSRNQKFREGFRYIFRWLPLFGAAAARRRQQGGGGGGPGGYTSALLNNNNHYNTPSAGGGGNLNLVGGGGGGGGGGNNSDRYSNTDISARSSLVVYGPGPPPRRASFLVSRFTTNGRFLSNTTTNDNNTNYYHYRRYKAAGPDCETDNNSNNSGGGALMSTSNSCHNIYSPIDNRLL